MYREIFSNYLVKMKEVNDQTSKYYAFLHLQKHDTLCMSACVWVHACVYVCVCLFAKWPIPPENGFNFTWMCLQEIMIYFTGQCVIFIN